MEAKRHDIALKMAINIVERGGIPPSDGVKMIAEALIDTRERLDLINDLASELVKTGGGL